MNLERRASLPPGFVGKWQSDIRGRRDRWEGERIGIQRERGEMEGGREIDRGRDRERSEGERQSERERDRQKGEREGGVEK